MLTNITNIILTIFCTFKQLQKNPSVFSSFLTSEIHLIDGVQHGLAAWV